MRATTKRITVEITPDDIREGVYRSGDTCPIALAFRRRLNVPAPCVTVCTFTLDAGFRDREGRPLFATFALPKKASAFIKAFDQGHPVRPFSFCLNVPIDCIPEENKRPLYEGGAK